MKRAERPCHFCGAELKGTRRRKCCTDPVCIEKQKEEKKESARRIERKARHEEKFRNIQANPKNCIHCGAEFTIEDDLRYPACNRCMDWWDENKILVRRDRERLKKRRMRLKPEKKVERTVKVSNPRTLHFSDNDWSHEKYEALQEKLKVKNGRRCQWWVNIGAGEENEDCNPESPAQLIGNDRFYCKHHQQFLQECNGRIDNHFLYDGEAYGNYDVW